MMSSSFFTTYPFSIPIVAILVAEILKLIITFHGKKGVGFDDFFRSGGMPSGHATLVSSMTMTAFLMRGIHSFEFSISFIFAIIVIYDAIKLRWEAGKHAKALNFLIGEKRLEERLGHTVPEIFCGIFLGAGISFLLIAF
jgi:acid phosphatase family membrane protein YuiD